MWTTSCRFTPHYIDLHFARKPFQETSSTLSRLKPGVNKHVILWISGSLRTSAVVRFQGSLAVEPTCWATRTVSRDP